VAAHRPRLCRSGGGYYLGSVLSPDRSREAWETALDGLGVRSWPDVTIMADGDHAIESAVGQCLPGKRVQRCAWHVLHNASEWVQERYRGKEHEGLRKGLLAGARGRGQRRQCRDAARVAGPPGGSQPLVWSKASPQPQARRLSRHGRTSHQQCLRAWLPRVAPEDTPHGRLRSARGLRNFTTLWMLKENARTLKLNWLEVLMP